MKTKISKTYKKGFKDGYKTHEEEVFIKRGEEILKESKRLLGL